MYYIITHGPQTRCANSQLRRKRVPPENGKRSCTSMIIPFHHLILRTDYYYPPQTTVVSDPTGIYFLVNSHPAGVGVAIYYLHLPIPLFGQLSIPVRPWDEDTTYILHLLLERTPHNHTIRPRRSGKREGPWKKTIIMQVSTDSTVSVVMSQSFPPPATGTNKRSFQQAGEGVPAPTGMEMKMAPEPEKKGGNVDCSSFSSLPPTSAKGPAESIERDNNANNNDENNGNNYNPNGNQVAKKRKLSPASKEARQQEKEMRERQRQEEKAKREEERRIKEEEKKKRDAEREAKKKLKDEERAAKEEEKRKREEEKMKKERVSNCLPPFSLRSRLKMRRIGLIRFSRK